MKIHEYQAKQLLKEYKIPVAKGIIIEKVEDAIPAAKEIGGKVWVVKAQIHAGGRGKGGGVKVAKTLDEVKQYTDDILGMNLITIQTGPEGKIVNKVYIESGANIQKEYYIAIVLDRKKEMPVVIASTEGGMEIEKVAEETPNKIVKVSIDPMAGMTDFYVREIGYGIKLTKDQLKNFAPFIKQLYKMYIETDVELVEINPLITTDKDDFFALDAKMIFDDTAIFRHPEISKLRDRTEEEQMEMEAAEYDLNYVKLDGSVGCMVNGAGLAMSTMDIIKHEGGDPANFLDVGGGANAITVAKGFEIILKDPNVKAIFVNIFGGIVRCDRIANGIIEATKVTKVTVPVIVRLDGTNAIEAAEILKNAKIDNIITAYDLSDGAKKAVKAARGEK